MQDKLRIESEKFLQIEMQEEKNIERRESAEKKCDWWISAENKIIIQGKKTLESNFTEEWVKSIFRNREDCSIAFTSVENVDWKSLKSWCDIFQEPSIAFKEGKNQKCDEYEESFRSNACANHFKVLNRK